MSLEVDLTGANSGGTDSGEVNERGRVQVEQENTSKFQLSGEWVLVGEGAFSSVYRCYDEQQKKPVAVKVVPFARSEMFESMMREVGVFEQVQSPHVVRYIGRFYTADALHVVLEYMDAGSLDTLIKHSQQSGQFPIPEKVIHSIAVQMLLGLAALHSTHVLHRDIKPSNVLLSRSGEVKFADFNTSRVMKETVDAFSFTGSAHYMSPERLLGRGHNSASDIWSFGVTLYEVLAGTNPFKSSSTDFFHLIHSVSEAPIPSLPHRTSIELADLLTKCLSREPKDRPSAEELLAHPFVTRGHTRYGGQSDIAQWISQTYGDE